MIRYSEAQLEQYVDFLFQRFALGAISVSPGSMKQEDNFFHFIGNQPMQKTRRFVIPFETRSPGVIVARSILKGSRNKPMSWLINGQASNNSSEMIFIGAGSYIAISLHPSKEMLRDWTHAHLENAPDEMIDDWTGRADKAFEQHVSAGLYADKASIGDYSETDGISLRLCLHPLDEPVMNSDIQEPSPIGIGR
jgi:hypothetical protein